MPIIRLASIASDDLVEVWAYVAENDRNAANLLIEKFWNKFGILSRNPILGRKREYSKDLRSLPVDRYLIFYRPLENGVEILRVLHGARDLDQIFVDL